MVYSEWFPEQRDELEGHRSGTGTSNRVGVSGHLDSFTRPFIMLS